TSRMHAAMPSTPCSLPLATTSAASSPGCGFCCSESWSRSVYSHSPNWPETGFFTDDLLASCRDGCTEAIMLAHGFTIPQMVELVHAGLAMATGERVVAGRKTIEV